MTYSVKRYFEIMGANGGDSYFRTDQPFDAGYTWTMMDNVFHMLDMMGKYRINWVNNYSAGRHPGPMVLYFPITMVSPYTYPNFDLRIAAGGGNSEVEIRASIVLPEVQGPIGGVGIGYGIIGQATGTTPITDVEWVIDTTITTGNVDVAPVTFTQAPAYAGDAGVVGNHHFLKLLIEYDYQVSESGPTALIYGVQLREYPV